MADYRAYVVESDVHFQQAIPLDCADDAEAVANAEQLVDGHDIELWQRDQDCYVQP